MSGLVAQPHPGPSSVAGGAIQGLCRPHFGGHSPPERCQASWPRTPQRTRTTAPARNLLHGRSTPARDPCPTPRFVPQSSLRPLRPSPLLASEAPLLASTGACSRDLLQRTGASRGAPVHLRPHHSVRRGATPLRSSTAEAFTRDPEAEAEEGVTIDVEASVSDVASRDLGGSSSRVTTGGGNPATAAAGEEQVSGAEEYAASRVGGRWRRRRKPSVSDIAAPPGSPQDNPTNPTAATEDSSSALPQGHADDVSKEEAADGEGEEDGEEEEMEPGFRMSRVCDRLVDVFWVEKPTPEEWRKLLAYSDEWARIRPHFFKRCEGRAREMQEQQQPGKAAELFRLGRRLKEVDESMQVHDELLALVSEDEEGMDGIVARRRKDFTGGFFDHVRLRCEAAFKNLPKQEAMISLASKILNSVEQHDRLMENEVAVEAAQAKFDDIMGSTTLQEACGKIDSLAERQQLDSTLMLMITKAWAAAKESNMMHDEVRDVMYHLYMQALSNMRMQVPKEVRILRHVLSLEDPREMLAALTAAFSPGDELEVQNSTEDYLYTTPDNLLSVIEQVLTAYYSNKETTLIEEAKKLMNPAVIKQLEILKQIIVDEFK